MEIVKVIVRLLGVTALYTVPSYRFGAVLASVCKTPLAYSPIGQMREQRIVSERYW